MFDFLGEFGAFLVTYSVSFMHIFSNQASSVAYYGPVDTQAPAPWVTDLEEVQCTPMTWAQPPRWEAQRLYGDLESVCDYPEGMQYDFARLVQYFTESMPSQAKIHGNPSTTSFGRKSRTYFDVTFILPANDSVSLRQDVCIMHDGNALFEYSALTKNVKGPGLASGLKKFDIKASLAPDQAKVLKLHIKTHLEIQKPFLSTDNAFQAAVATKLPLMANHIRDNFAREVGAHL